MSPKYVLGMYLKYIFLQKFWPHDRNFYQLKSHENANLRILGQKFLPTQKFLAKNFWPQYTPSTTLNSPIAIFDEHYC